MKKVLAVLVLLAVMPCAYAAEVPEILKDYWGSIIPIEDDEARYLVQKGNVIAIVDAENNIVYDGESDNIAPSYSYANSSDFNPWDEEHDTPFGETQQTAQEIVSIPQEIVQSWESAVRVKGEGVYYHVLKDGLWGVVDNENNIILEPCLPFIRSMFGGEGYCFEGFGANGLGMVFLNQRYGMIDTQGNFVIPAEYETAFQFSRGSSVMRKNGKYGLISESGEILLQPVYEQIDGDQDGVRRIKADGKYGYIKTDGTFIAEPQYEDAAYRFTQLTARVKQNGKWGVINIYGRPLTEIIYDEVSDFCDGYARVNLNGRWGYINMSGEYIIEPQFAAADDFQSIYALVSPEKDKWGVINAEGEYILKPEYQSISYASRSKYVSAFAGGELYYFNLYNDKALPAGEPHESQPFLPPFTSGYNTSGKHYVLDSTGRMVVQPLYDDINIATDGSASAELNGKTIYLDLSSGGVREIKAVGSSFTLDEYKPNAGSKVAVLDEEPTLARRVSDEEPLPALDGATALFPVYSSIVQNLYPTGTTYDNQKNEDGNPLVICTKTNEAYRRLIDGRADMIFVAQPSDAQVADAKAAGVEFELTPFGKEAFVFIVNKDNPLDNITVEQIQDIYSGKLTEWSDLGVEDLGGIIAYQRPKNSGSQTALEKLMGDIPLMEAPQEVVAWDMGDILDTVEYRNLPNAIGYTFRFYCTEMVGSDVKLLSIDGVAPTAENIRNDSYPITSTLYAVTRKGDTNPNTVALLKWIQTAQAMELVEKSGYIPWYTFED